jgi:hypothetical protein
MNRLLVSVMLAAMMPLTVSGAIVYSGSQSVVLQLSPMDSMSSMGINLARQGEKWDDFQVSLWLDTGMMSMMGMPGMMVGEPMTMMSLESRLAIFAPGVMIPGAMSVGMGMGMGMGGILGFMDRAMSFPMGSMIGPGSDVVEWGYLYNEGGIDDEGGYIGVVTPDGRYGWLHVEGQSGIDTENHSVVIDGWAYEDRPGVPVAAGEGPCDWLPGGPHKMHWPQAPDLSAGGLDVSEVGTVLADDFKCTATGPVSRIHIWGSFADDLLPTGGVAAMTFEVSICSDSPAGRYPASPLWTRTFGPGEYAVRMVHDGPEGWYDPLRDTYHRDNHRQAYQFNFCADKDPFVQQEGTVYWLVVRPLDRDNAAHKFGWKSTCPELRWNHDAVYQAADGSWQTLAYPARHENEGQSLDLAFVIDSGRDLQAKYDLGDAPDSSNSLSTEMTAYPKNDPAGTTAHFPTVYQAGAPPYGPFHRNPKDTAFLGYGVTLENEADIGPDADPTNNLDPAADLSDADGSDDGVIVPLVLPDSEATKFDYVVTVIDPRATHLYVNVWFDWDRDGDWDDTLICDDGAEAPEWAVQNQELNLPGIGPHTLTTPAFRSWHPSVLGDLDPLWMRITLSDSPWNPSLGAGGAGPAQGYAAGETEDYYFQPRNEPAPATHDWGDAPGTRTSGYPTLSEHKGARHAIAGPWLGDAPGVPDAELDGQPDPNALGDDTDGNDDEEGVWIPPLVPGEPASLMVEVGGGGGIVQGWIDFNGDAAWQDDEQVCNGYLPDGINTITVPVPPDAVVGESFARFRISSKGGLQPEGPAPDGEVEDYDVSIRAAPPQLKRIQWPDLTANGIDIRMDSSDKKTRWLADDFKCTSTNRITEIRLWGSWKNDRKGQIQKIHLSIHADDPAGAAGASKLNRFSKPDPEALWTRTVGAGEFTETCYHIVRDIGEWWWDPATGVLTPGGDTEVWQIDIPIRPKEAFLQQGSPAVPVIYWLQVRVETTDGQFGWKTRRWPDHYMDDAVWDLAEKPAAWKELRYPKEHPYYCLEQNSIDLSFALTYTEEVIEYPTTRPGSVTQCPVVETQCPAVETRCPAVKTQCPTYKTRCPTTRTKCPVVSTQCPLVATRCPMVRTKCPTTATKCPPTRTKCPVVATRCPEALTRCPPTPTTCQVGETKCPPVATKCPVVATKCPETLTRCPPTPTNCQAVDTQCPAVETKCPPVTTKCPPTVTQCAVVGAATQCPATVTQCPPVTTQCPESLTKCPPTATKCQVVETQCPAVETKCPTAATKCPETLTRCPPTPTNCQAVDTQCPAVQTKCPPVTTQCPFTATQCSVVTAATQCPVVATQCPVVSTKCPPTVTNCQVVDTECPAVETKCPPVTTRCPFTPTQCSGVTAATQCPVVATQCPVVTTQCPPTVTNCQVVDTECPAVATKCPVVTTRCPPTVTQCSNVTAATQCPVVATRCPPVTTQCPPTVTNCQTVDTECPAVTTKCPTVDTRCPEEKTKCPVVTTQCPVYTTKCPPTVSQCQTVQTECPTVATQCPIVSTSCPTSSTKCPPTATRCPVVDTQCPANPTFCPPSETKCPLVISKCLIIQTQCPAVNTQCPAVSTQCPVVSTQCPVVFTQCPATLTLCRLVKTQCPLCLPVPVLGAASPSAAVPPPATAPPCPALDVICPTVVVAKR